MLKNDLWATVSVNYSSAEYKWCFCANIHFISLSRGAPEAPYMISMLPLHVFIVTAFIKMHFKKLKESKWECGNAKTSHNSEEQSLECSCTWDKSAYAKNQWIKVLCAQQGLWVTLLCVFKYQGTCFGSWSMSTELQVQVSSGAIEDSWRAKVEEREK